MSEKTVVESRVAVVPNKDLGLDIYVNEKPLFSHQGLRSAFGGSLLGQVIAAASNTVPDGFIAYSSQTTFVRPAKSHEPAVYHIDRTYDGRAYATRAVRVTQGSDAACILVSTVSFQNNNIPPGNTLDYSTPIIETDVHPDDIPLQSARQLTTTHIDKSVRVVRGGAADDPFDWRPLGFRSVEQEPYKFVVRGFLRSSSPISMDSPSVHLSAIAYSSDEHLLAPAIYSNPEKVGQGIKNVTMVASLIHNLSFHDPSARADNWMACERSTSWAADGRVLVHQRMWNLKTGRLIMSGTQEALIRLKDQDKRGPTKL
ncbi:Thioesterase/thiol ester dehydrase-isomerase [Hypoxylon trugodes]|uniref:Thioesterase/thiol ester dehydrase-isomerase n=1 Tax=Hypoxylon trugodes TaxID=326681 RepID=UPI00218FD844|nr:Thioesterase/thiol ester dehydrase-isomerase [Hypoxylon trugodes]KAI1383380.1 Thioesterase/thiol ester dehydrase-isomerase [Hypoxylon trugodes]